ncbi:hypothetical protein DFH29DRAFT_968366 [Suillus ampliporus]|nr:hypothetical protein DFH29DRAFT_968366 [Suillus ampliporus]
MWTTMSSFISFVNFVISLSTSFASPINDTHLERSFTSSFWVVFNIMLCSGLNGTRKQLLKTRPGCQSWHCTRDISCTSHPRSYRVGVGNVIATLWRVNIMTILCNDLSRHSTRSSAGMVR